MLGSHRATFFAQSLLKACARMFPKFFLVFAVPVARFPACSFDVGPTTFHLLSNLLSRSLPSLHPNCAIRQIRDTFFRWWCPHWRTRFPCVPSTTTLPLLQSCSPSNPNKPVAFFHNSHKFSLRFTISSLRLSNRSHASCTRSKPPFTHRPIPYNAFWRTLIASTRAQKGLSTLASTPSGLESAKCLFAVFSKRKIFLDEVRDQCRGAKKGLLGAAHVSSICSKTSTNLRLSS